MKTMKHLSCAQHSVKVGNLVKILHKMHSWWAHSLEKGFYIFTNSLSSKATLAD